MAITSLKPATVSDKSRNVKKTYTPCPDPVTADLLAWTTDSVVPMTLAVACHLALKAGVGRRESGGLVVGLSHLEEASRQLRDTLYNGLEAVWKKTDGAGLPYLRRWAPGGGFRSDRQEEYLIRPRSSDFFREEGGADDSLAENFREETPDSTENVRGKFPSTEKVHTSSLLFVSRSSTQTKACMQAGGEGKKVPTEGPESSKSLPQGLSREEVDDLLARGLFGDWAASLPHDRERVLDQICSVEQEGFTLSRQEAEQMLSGGVMTARGAWAMVQTLSRRRKDGQPVCKSPHLNFRKWLRGDFVSRSGERNAYFRDFLGLAANLEALGWYERPIALLGPRERQALSALRRMEVAGLPMSEEEQEQAKIAIQRAQEARNAPRPSIPTPEEFLAREGGREALVTLKECLEKWAESLVQANAANRTARLSNRPLTDAEKGLVAESLQIDEKVVAFFARTGPFRLPFGVAHGDDRTQWRALFNALETLLQPELCRNVS